jgi:virginiamycin A acetyltransferase
MLGMNQPLKRVGQSLALVCVIPLYLSHLIGSRLKTPDDSLVGHSHLLALLPGRLGAYIRVAFYRLALASCDPTACIEFGCLFSKAGTSIGKNVYIGPYSQIGLATIEDDVLIGPSVLLLSGARAHGFQRSDRPIREQPGMVQRVLIGSDSWVGAGAIVMADVAPQTIVGAGSVVTKSYAAKLILAGNPARPLRSRFSSTHDGPGQPDKE